MVSMIQMKKKKWENWQIKNVSNIIFIANHVTFKYIHDVQLDMRIVQLDRMITHWDLKMYMYALVNRLIIASGNGLSPAWCQTIAWTDDDSQ